MGIYHDPRHLDTVKEHIQRRPEAVGRSFLFKLVDAIRSVVH